MIIPDVNLLLYTVNVDSPDHAAAYRWWEELLHSGAPIGLYSGVAFSFVRLSTNRRVFTHPLMVGEAFAYIQNWLEFSVVNWVDATLEDLPVAENLLQVAGTGGNLVSDAQIAAAAIRLGGTVFSVDSDFGRFPKVKWQNPLGK
ncbi:type II toxin-antitoxin system VapC family toxin [Puniceicoccales bacterium CK1056]|uniref:Ribonuclease VapC n=1 Tax=Oceanipulchritudo coccoides TaxID=2706888 RepID=A0A6B2M3H4_9BACT|nr:TA system VapC family ribonuclease toxin [Oceanipulchritudo coccoides]NDV62759.1 type II toxin-antitoxin system VapC family toxin [Oceanipulchritudo coccoides]